MANPSIVDSNLVRLRDIVAERRSIKQSSLPSLLKLDRTKVNKLIGILESEGILEKKKESLKGRTFNRIIYKGEKTISDEKDMTLTPEVIVKPLEGRRWCFMDDSPCFFCTNLDRCGEDSKGLINYINCPRLNEWIIGT